MTDPRITAALDRLDIAHRMDASVAAKHVPLLVAVLREVARMHVDVPEVDFGGNPYRLCGECGEPWPCATARALAPLTELGGDQ